MATSRLHKAFVAAVKGLGKGVLNLATTKRDVTATIVATLPAIFAAAVTEKTLVKAFVAAA